MGDVTKISATTKMKSQTDERIGNESFSPGNKKNLGDENPNSVVYTLVAYFLLM